MALIRRQHIDGDGIGLLVASFCSDGDGDNCRNDTSADGQSGSGYIRYCIFTRNYRHDIRNDVTGLLVEYVAGLCRSEALQGIGSEDDVHEVGIGIQRAHNLLYGIDLFVAVLSTNNKEIGVDITALVNHTHSDSLSIVAFHRNRIHMAGGLDDVVE